jgi:hypothetical protein
VGWSLENWYLSKLNEATVNKSHDDILIEYLKNISTETITSFESEYPQQVGIPRYRAF